MTSPRFRKINKLYLAQFLLYFVQGFVAYILWEIGSQVAAMVMLMLSGFMARVNAYEQRRKLWQVPVETCVAIDNAISVRHPRAVVLCGGGGKGAYQLGALRALAEADITFDLIIGSSVGALNAALILSNGIDKARQLFAEELAQTFKLSVKSALIAWLRILSLEGRFISIRRAGRFRKAAGFLLLALSMLLLLPDELPSSHEFWGLWRLWGFWNF